MSKIKYSLFYSIIILKRIVKMKRKSLSFSFEHLPINTVLPSESVGDVASGAAADTLVSSVHHLIMSCKYDKIGGGENDGGLFAKDSWVYLYTCSSKLKFRRLLEKS